MIFYIIPTLFLIQLLILLMNVVHLLKCLLKRETTINYKFVVKSFFIVLFIGIIGMVTSIIITILVLLAGATGAGVVLLLYNFLPLIIPVLFLIPLSYLKKDIAHKHPLEIFNDSYK